MSPIKLKNKDLDAVLIMTSKNQLSCLFWDEVTQSLKTEAVGNIAEMASKPCKKISVKSSGFYYPPVLSLGTTATSNGKQKNQKIYPVIGIHQYQGLFKVIPTTSTGFGEAFNVRLEPLDVLDWIWLDYSAGSSQTPTIASSSLVGSQPDFYILLILHQNINEAKVLDTFSLSVKNKELLPWKYHRKVDDSALFLIPITMGGFILVSENYVEYMNPLVPLMNCSTTFRPTFFTTYCMIDENRYLLSDSDGVMYILALMLSPTPSSAPSIYCTALGVTCLPSSISYVQDGYVFVGSKFGDSMLVQLLDEEEARFYPIEERLPPPPVLYNQRQKMEETEQVMVKDAFPFQELASSSIRLVQTFPGMGPISDFCVVERQGQGIIVACCGAYQDSTLRIIRNGIGMEVYGKGEIENCLAVYSLGFKGKSLVIVCLIDETRILESSISPNSEQVFLESSHNYGFETECTTLHTFLAHKSNYIVQVSHEFVRVISTSNLQKVSEWRMDQGDLDTQINDSEFCGEISHCTLVNDHSIAIGVGPTVLVLSISSESGTIAASKKYNAEDQISSLTVSSKEYLVFSTWSTPPVVTFLRIRDFQVVEHVAIPSSSQNMIHGIFSLKFESAHDEYVLVSMSDGDLFYFTTSSTLKFKITSSIKRTNLGSQPATFYSFRNNNQTNVFACSDRPTILYHRASKLLFSSVNLKNVAGIASLPNVDNQSVNEKLIVATDEGILIGEMEAVQKLHVKSVKVGETCRRIIEWGEHWYGVVTVSHTVVGDERKEVNFVCLFDSTTFEVADRFELQEYEHATCLLVADLSTDSTRYLIVGTGLAYPNLDEPLEGRILIFSLSKTQDRQLELIHETKVTGCVYSMVTLHGKLIAGINAKVMVFDWDVADKFLQLECTHYGYVIALYLVTRGEMIIVGDLMKSVSCLFYDVNSKTMSIHCRDFDTRWITSVETLESSQVVIGSDNYKNLFTLQKDTDNRGMVMVMGSRFHLGELVNRFRRGSLIMKTGDSPLIANPILLFCTVSGSIGVISTVDDETFSILDRLQTQMQKLESVGMLRAEEFRTFENDRSRQPSSGVIDGDLLENFTELAVEVKNEISGLVGMSVEEVSNIIQEISRLY